MNKLLILAVQTIAVVLSVLIVKVKRLHNNDCTGYRISSIVRNFICKNTDDVMTTA